MESLNSLFYIHLLKRLLGKVSFRSKWRVEKLIKNLTPKMKDNIIVKTRYGFKMLISPIYDRGIERSIFYDGSYEKGTLWCFDRILKKGYVVFDIGANIGLTSLYASRKISSNGMVYSFEPLKSTYDILEFNINLNKAKNVKIERFALSDFIGFGRIYNNIEINRGAASLIINKQFNDYGEKVPIISLDSYCEKELISGIDFIKIDIEGCEYPMLKGGIRAIKKFKPIICLEFSRDVKSNYNPDLIFELLKKENYKVYKQLNGKESYSKLVEVLDLKNLPNHDNLYCFQVEHINGVAKSIFA